MPVKFVQLAPPGLSVSPFAVPCLGHCQGGVHVDLHEPSLPDQLPRHLPLRPEGGDERDEDDQSGVDHEVDHFSDAPDVLDAISIGEPKVLVQSVPYIVPVEEVGVTTLLVELPLDNVGDG